MPTRPPMGRRPKTNSVARRSTRSSFPSRKRAHAATPSRWSAAVLAITYAAVAMLLLPFVRIDVRDLVGPIRLWPALVLILGGVVSGFLTDYFRPPSRRSASAADCPAGRFRSGSRRGRSGHQSRGPPRRPGAHRPVHGTGTGSTTGPNQRLQQGIRRWPAKGLLEFSAPAGDIVAHEGIGNGDVTVGVEAPDQFVALVVQVAFDLVAPLPASDPAPRGDSGAAPPAEPAVEFGRGAVSNVGDAAGQGQPCSGTDRRSSPRRRIGILADGQCLGLGEGNLFGRLHPDGNHGAAPHPFRITDCPLKGAGSAERAS